MTPEPDEDLQLKLIIDADLLEDIIDALDAIVNEFRIQWLDGMIRIWAQDPATVAAFYLDLKPDHDAIQHYSVVEDGVQNGLKTDMISDLLGYAEADTMIKVELGERHNWRYNISMPGVDVNLAGIDSESLRENPNRPTLDWPAAYYIDGDDFRDGVQLADMFTTHAAIQCLPDGTVEITGEGDSDDATYRLEESEEDVEFIHHPEDPTRSKFNIEHLKSITSVLKDYDDIRVESGQEIPLSMHTDLFDYILAPTILRN